MYYNVSHDNLHVKLCNQDVHIVSKEIYLGKYISENIYDRAIKQTICAFNAKSIIYLFILFIQHLYRARYSQISVL